MTFVVDASVAVKWMFPELLSKEAERLLRPGRELLAPDFMWAEVASAACKKVRRGETQADNAAELLRDFRRLPIKTISSKTLMQIAWDVALTAGLSVYDGLYVALSYRRDCSLVTADRKLYDKVRAVYPHTEMIWLENFRA